MATPLRVLLIEDSEDDAELLLRELRRGGYEPRWRRVDTAEALTEALREGGWEVITCDYVMPRFSALAALKLIRDGGFDLPVIIVSGQVGEDVAVSAMKAGAHDYVSKHRMVRLVPAIARELAEVRERRRVAATLTESDARYRELVESLHDVVFEIGPDERLRYVSPSIARVAGVPPEHYVGRPFREIIYPDDLPMVLESLQRTLGGRLEPLTYRVITPAGAVRWVRTFTRPVFDAAGQWCALRGVLTDVTDQVEAEQAYRTIFEHSQQGLALVQDDRIVLANPALAALTGLSRDELHGASALALAAALVHPDDRERMPQAAGADSEGGACPRGVEFRIRRRDGQVRHVTISHTDLAYRGRAGRLVACIDLTDRIEAEAAYRSIFECSLESLLVVSGAHVLMANQAAADLTGYTVEELTAMPTPVLIDRLVHPADRAGLERSLAAYLAGQAAQTRFEFCLRRRDGQERRVLNSCTSMSFAGRPAVLVAQVDITERWRAEADLRALNSALEARVEERTAALQATARELEAFTYSASHDLRAPLRVIDGFCQALVEDYGAALPEGARALLQRVILAAGGMRQLLDQLLMLSRVAGGALRREPVDLTLLAREIAAEHARDGDGRIAITVEDGLRAEGDAALLRAVLDNLLDNAVKFSRPRPRAEIAVGARAGGDGRVFFVRDNGVGFDPEYAERLFRPFQRLHSSTEFSGHGIGLATVSRIITRHGGRVWAESVPGRGATFYFTLA
jgi:PAS domain S-box-containing protein